MTGDELPVFLTSGVWAPGSCISIFCSNGRTTEDDLSLFSGIDWACTGAVESQKHNANASKPDILLPLFIKFVCRSIYFGGWIGYQNAGWPIQYIISTLASFNIDLSAGPMDMTCNTMNFGVERMH